jgi:hypothetical protein
VGSTALHRPWNFSDDDGRMPFSPKKIKMLVFPGDEVDVSACLEELSREELIRVYEREGGRYLAIRNFGKHQKIDHKSASTIPNPLDDSSSSPQRALDEPSISTRRAIDEPSSTERNGTEGNGTEKEKTSAPSQAPAKEVDSRYQPLVDVIHERYRTMNETDCPWSAKDGRQAKELLASLDRHDWTIEKLDRCAQFKLLSLDHSATEAPHVWLRRLASYYEAPLDRFGRPDFEKRDRWLRKREASTSSSKIAVVQAPRELTPDPGVAAFVESLPRDPWSLILDVIGKRVNQQSFDTWLKPIRFYGVAGKTLVVRVPHPGFTHITDKWGELISQVIEELRFPFDEIELEANG